MKYKLKQKKKELSFKKSVKSVKIKQINVLYYIFVIWEGCIFL